MSKKITKKRIIGLFVVSLLAGLVVFTTVGCRNVEPVTSADFESAMSELGYTTTDATSDYDSSGFQIDKGLLLETTDGLHVEFMEFGSNDEATSFFNTAKGHAESFKGSASAESSVQNSSHSKYTLKTDEAYYVVERVGITGVYAYCPVADSSDLDKIISAINY